MSSCCKSTSEILSWSEGMRVLASSAVSQQRVPLLGVSALGRRGNGGNGGWGAGH